MQEHGVLLGGFTEGKNAEQWSVVSIKTQVKVEHRNYPKLWSGLRDKIHRTPVVLGDENHDVMVSRRCSRRRMLRASTCPWLKPQLKRLGGYCAYMAILLMFTVILGGSWLGGGDKQN